MSTLDIYAVPRNEYTPEPVSSKVKVAMTDFTVHNLNVVVKRYVKSMTLMLSR